MTRQIPDPCAMFVLETGQSAKFYSHEKMAVLHAAAVILQDEIDALRRNNRELTDQRFVLMEQVSTLLGHMDTIRNCTNDPAISSLARVVLERFEAQKATPLPDNAAPMPPPIIGLQDVHDAITADPTLADCAQEPHVWMIQGSHGTWKGEHAEMDAKAEAKRCGGTCYAYPLYTHPAPKGQA